MDAPQDLRSLILFIARRITTEEAETLADEVETWIDRHLSRYCTLVYARTGSYEASARRLGLDRRTVKAKIDPAWLEKFRRDS